MRVLIGTPAYGGMVHLDYLNSLLEFQKQGLQFSLASFGNESLITRARNSIISYFYHHRQEFSHLLFLDADIRLAAIDLKKLMDYEVDVIAAPVPLKSYAADGNPPLNCSPLETKVAEDLYTTSYVGTAVLLLSRRAVTDVVEKTKKEGRTYRFPAKLDTNENLTGMEMYDVFQVGIADGEYLSEDYWLCRELTSLGHKVHVCDTIRITHHGMHGFQEKDPDNEGHG